MSSSSERVERALTTLKAGGLVIVTDDDQREAEGDMVGLAQYATAATVNQMVTHARGLLCVPLTATRATQLGLRPMVPEGTDAFGTAFTVGTDAKTTSTGISADDRATTIRQLAATTAQPADFYHPGHVFPLIAREHGTLERAGHTEAAVDLAKLAGATPVAYICEILRKDGKMAHRRQLKPFAEGSQLPLLSIQDIQDYRYQRDVDVLTEIPAVALPTRYGDFRLTAYQTFDGQEPTLLISKGPVQPGEPLLLRVHSECFTGDVLGSKRCDCGEQLQLALQAIEAHGSGAVLYLRQEGRGIGLANKLRAYRLQEQGLDTVEANQRLGFRPDQRNYGLVAAVLHRLRVSRVALMTNNPDKIAQLKQLGIQVERRVPLETTPQPENRQYLKTKQQKFHHYLKEV